MRPSRQKEKATRSRCAGVMAAIGAPVLVAVVTLGTTACSCDAESGTVVYATDVRTVTVTGTADVMVDPDQVVIVVGVQATEDRPAAAKSQSDAIAQKVFQEASDHGVEDVDVQTEYVSVNPEYGYDSSYQDRYGSDRRVIVGYTASQTIAITLKDLSKFEDLLTSLLDAGVEYVHNINFETSELRKHRDEARDLAVEAAKEKAAALAGELDQSLGRPTEIVESQERSNPWYGYAAGISNTQLMAADESLANEATIAPGQLTVSATVTVTFELK